MQTIAAQIEISPQQIILNGEPLPVADDGNDLLTAAYRQQVNDYPKFFKMDGLSKLCFVASELLLQTVDEERFVERDDRAVVLMGRSGSIHADRHYLTTISDRDNFFPSPSVFVYTLPNIAAGEVAIRNKYLGETAFYALHHQDEAAIQNLIRSALMDESTGSVLAGWADYFDKTHFEVKMKLINKD